jgi:hypothetical protein
VTEKRFLDAESAFWREQSALRARVDELERLAAVRNGAHWIDDHLRNPIVRTGGVNETRNNAVVTARYKIDADGFCDWEGHYILGTTTSWAAGALALVLPVNPESTTFVGGSTSMPGVTLRAYNGGFFPGYVEYNGAGNLGTVSCFNASQAPSAAAAWSTSVPFTWGNTHILSWHLRYPTT